MIVALLILAHLLCACGTNYALKCLETDWVDGDLDVLISVTVWPLVWVALLVGWAGRLGSDRVASDRAQLKAATEIVTEVTQMLRKADAENARLVKLLSPAPKEGVHR